MKAESPHNLFFTMTGLIQVSMVIPKPNLFNPLRIQNTHLGFIQSNDQRSYYWREHVFYGMQWMVFKNLLI